MASKADVELMDKVVFMKAVPMFQSYDLGTLASIVEIMDQNNFSEGDTIIEFDKTVRRLHLIYKGKVEIVQPVKSGDEVSIAEVEAETLVGGQSLIDGAASPYKVVARSDVITLSLTRKNYQHLIEVHPELALGLLKELCRDLGYYQTFLARD